MPAPETHTESERPSLAQRSLVGALASALWYLGRLSASIIAARMLGLEGAGQVGFLFWLVETGFLVVGLGLQLATTRFLARLIGRGDQAGADALAGWIARRYLLLMIIGELLVQLAGPSLSKNPLPPELWGLVSVWFAIRALEELARAYLIGSQRFADLAKMNAQIGVVAVTGVFLGAWIYGLAGAIVGYLCSALLPALFGLGVARHVGKAPSEDVRREVWSYAISCWVAAVLSAMIWTRMEVWFIERLRDFREVGIFSTGLNMANVAMAAPLMLGSALLPHFSERHGAEDMGALVAGYQTGTRLLAVLLFPMCVGLAAVVPTALPLVFGDGFHDAIPTATVLCLGAGLQFGTVAASLCYGIGRAWFIALTCAISAALYCVGLIYVIPIHGALGAAYVRVAVQTLLVSVGCWYVATRVHCPVPLWALTRTLICAALCGGTARFMGDLLPGAQWLAVHILAGAVVYILAMRVLRVVPKEDAAVLDRAIGRFPGPLQKVGRAVMSIAGARR